MFEQRYTKRIAILWTILALGSLYQLINPFKEPRDILTLISEISSIMFSILAIESWIGYYKKKKEIMTDKSDKIKD